MRAKQNTNLLSTREKQVLERYLKTGVDWRIGWQPHGLKYQGLVGSDSWAIELTKAELSDFCRLINQLVETMMEMSTELMDQESISCEAETSLLWLEAEGFPQSYTLRLIVHGERHCEGNWQAGIAPKLLEAINSLGIA